MLHSVARYYDSIMQCFGLEGRVLALVQGESSGSGGAGDGAGGCVTATPLQLAAAMSGFRDTVRKAAIASKKKSDVSTDLDGELLRVCDELRDDVLPGLGVRVEDRPSGTAQFTLDDPKLIQAETERRREAARKAEVRSRKLHS